MSFWPVYWMLINLADLGMTAFILSRGGMELNPVTNSLVALVVAKTLVPVLVIYVLERRHKLHWLEGLSLGMTVVVLYPVGHLIFGVLWK